ncbi:hypothetical protein A7X12_19575 [Sphingomonas sp. TDK1]|nr:hypothetical protein A7X12_19575 [Sphingomonas sp. TDK1]
MDVSASQAQYDRTAVNVDDGMGLDPEAASARRHAAVSISPVFIHLTVLVDQIQVEDPLKGGVRISYLLIWRAVSLDRFG